jgi:hypothetical protein
LGPLPLTVETARGKHHSYVQGDVSLPGKIRLFDGLLVGEIRRKPTEYVVCPPSTFQGGRYECLVDRIELAPLPEPWREYLRTQPKDAGERGEPFSMPDRIDAGGDGHVGTSRHETFFRWTRSWKASGFTIDEVLAVLLEANRCITHPPLEEDHLTRYIARCFNQEDRPQWRTR